MAPRSCHRHLNDAGVAGSAFAWMDE
jgi:hypothetical protein